MKFETQKPLQHMEREIIHESIEQYFTQHGTFHNNLH